MTDEESRVIASLRRDACLLLAALDKLDATAARILDERTLDLIAEIREDYKRAGMLKGKS